MQHLDQRLSLLSTQIVSGRPPKAGSRVESETSMIINRARGMYFYISQCNRRHIVSRDIISATRNRRQRDLTLCGLHIRGTSMVQES